MDESTLFQHISDNCNGQNNAATKLKAVQILKTWLEQYQADFEVDSDLKQKLEYLLQNLENQKLAQMIRNTMSKKPPPMVIEFPDSPKLILPKFTTRDAFLKIKLMEFDPTELARQITLIEFDLFSKIKPRELVGLSWMKNGNKI